MIPRVTTFLCGDLEWNSGTEYHYFGGKIIQKNYDFTTVFLSDVTAKDLTTDNRFMYFLPQAQQYKVEISKTFSSSPQWVNGKGLGVMIDCSEWFQSVLKFIADAENFWSVELTDTNYDDKIRFHFTFADLQTAVMFRFKYQ
jgi:hypothetical protein